MQQEIVMPQLGLTMTEGSVSAWMKKPGDKVERGDILFLVETDKVEMEVESFVSGVLDSLLLEPAVIVKVGTVIATIEDGRPAVLARPIATAPAEPMPWNGNSASAPMAQTRSDDRQFPVSPRARKMALSLGIDLALVVPANGTRIVEEDVRRFQEQEAEKAAPTPQPEIPKSSTPKTGRAVIAQRMASSFQSAPHFYLTAHVDAGKLVEVRNACLEIFQARHGIRVTYTDFFLRALAQALKESPAVNSFWNGDQAEQRQSIDLSIATQTPHGLLTPLLTGADQLSFVDLAKERRSLVEKARSRKLTLRELEGGSATLSNLGTHKIDEFHAILNPPQSVILATGQIAKRPMVVGNSVEARSTVFLTLSSDHRVLDGVDAAEFLDRIRELLENPYGLAL